ncbi:hypothetical protein HanIR_Chr15g0755271 [Helianthus annuus]|nr:hypothetical protein HanIR_Chr15g0755271 [Helianthus annuus]
MTMMIQWRHPTAVVTARVSFRVRFDFCLGSRFGLGWLTGSTSQPQSSGLADSVYLGGSDLGLFSVRHSSVTVHSVQVRFDKKTGR